jgi:hypothetical protein
MIWYSKIRLTSRFFEFGKNIPGGYGFVESGTKEKKS